MNEKLLVVDDEHDIADLLEVYLQNENYIVYKFNSAKDALTCIEQEELDLGSDDYVTKPFRPLELITRVKAQLRLIKYM